MENKPASSEFDQFADQYAELLDDPLRRMFAAGTSFFHRRKIEILQRAIRARRLEPAKMTWIDVGCGQGELLKLGSPVFGAVAGCDVSREMLAHCEGLSVRHQPDFTRIPFEDASADLITAVCIFHHVEEQDRLPLMLDIVRVLKPGGAFAMIEHNPWNPATQWIVRRSPVDENAHLLFPGKSRRLLRRAALEITAQEYFLYFPEKLYGRLAAVEAGLRKLPLGGQYLVMGEKAH
jgi:SAM-dependent methyltransferase